MWRLDGIKEGYFYLRLSLKYLNRKARPPIIPSRNIAITITTIIATINLPTVLCDVRISHCVHYAQ